MRSTPLVVTSRLTLGLISLCCAAQARAGADGGSAASTSDERCVSQREATVDVDAWRAKVKKLTEPAAVKAALANVDLLQDVETNECTGQPTRVSVDHFKAPLVSGAFDSVVQVRGQLCGKRVLAGAVLHPLRGASRYCVTKMPFLPGELPAGTESIKFDFVILTHPERQAFRVDGKTQDQNGSSHDIAFWEFQDGKLYSIWEGGWYDQEVGFSHSATDYRLEISFGDSPHKITVTQTVHSESMMASGTYTSDENSSETFCYQPSKAPDGPRMKYEKC